MPSPLPCRCVTPTVSLVCPFAVLPIACRFCTRHINTNLRGKGGWDEKRDWHMLCAVAGARTERELGEALDAIKLVNTGERHDDPHGEE